MEITMVLLAAMVVGLVEAVKQLNPPTKALPFIALALGIVIMLGFGFLAGVVGVREQIFYGLMIGLEAMGLWSGGKAIIANNKDNK